MTQWYNNLNGITPGTTLTNSNTGGQAGASFDVVFVPTGGSVTAETGAAYEGDAGLQIVHPAGTDSAGSVRWGVSQAVGTRLATSFWYKFGAVPSGQTTIACGTGSTAVSIRLSATGQLQATDDTSAVIATTAALTAGSWYFVQYAVTTNVSQTGGRIEFRVLDTARTVLTSFDSGATIDAGITPNGLFLWGRPFSSTVGLASSYDALAVDTTLPVGTFPAGAVTLPFTETFTGTTGAAWPPAWVTKNNNGLTGGSASIQANAGQLVSASSAYKSYEAVLELPRAAREVDVTFTFTFAANAEQYLGLSFNAEDTSSASNGGFAPKNGYALTVEFPAGGAGGVGPIEKYLTGAVTALGSSVAKTFAAATAYKLRFQRLGTTLRFRTWAASGSEPGTWDSSVTDSGSQPTGSTLLLRAGNGADGIARTVTIDDFTVAVTPGAATNYVTSGTAAGAGAAVATVTAVIAAPVVTSTIQHLGLIPLDPATDGIWGPALVAKINEIIDTVNGVPTTGGGGGGGGTTTPPNPLFVYDFQTGNRFQWPAYNAVNLARQITVANNVLPQRSARFPYTARFEVDPALDVLDPGNFRAEVAQDASTGLNISTAGGSVRWLAWSTYFPTDFVWDASWFVFTQMRPMQSGSSPLVGFEIANVGGVATMRVFCNGGTYSSATSYQYQSGSNTIGAPTLGAWNDLLVKIVWSPDPTVGEVTVWLNGILKIDRWKVSNMIPTIGAYLKQGIYCSDTTTLKHVLGHTGMRVGATQADVA